MARAGDNPRAWKELLSALNVDDIKTAQKLAVKYEFGKDVRKKHKKRIGKVSYTYFCESPDGEVTTFKTAEGVSDFLEVNTHYIYIRFYKGQTTWNQGRLKGWKLWREKK